MSCQSFETDSFCVRRRHTSATTEIVGDVTSNSNKVLTGYCSVSNRKKSMTVKDNTIVAEGLGDVFKFFDKKKDLMHQKRLQKCFEKSLKSFGDRC